MGTWSWIFGLQKCSSSCQAEWTFNGWGIQRSLPDSWRKLGDSGPCSHDPVTLCSLLGSFSFFTTLVVLLISSICMLLVLWFSYEHTCFVNFGIAPHLMNGLLWLFDHYCLNLYAVLNLHQAPIYRMGYCASSCKYWWVFCFWRIGVVGLDHPTHLSKILHFVLFFV